MLKKVVTVFGGSGFVGRSVVQRLAKKGALVRVACRNPEAAASLRPTHRAASPAFRQQRASWRT
ncbi:MAG: NmrA family NAD(P)-binding protein, partial [Alphaproteobacteria bacterium]|nr:NmrA family NAD(P)-binding protein [Alphaproteobacteria bacterium]